MEKRSLKNGPLFKVLNVIFVLGFLFVSVSPLTVNLHSSSFLNYDTSSITSSPDAKLTPTMFTFGTSSLNETLSLARGAQEYFFSASTPEENITNTSWSPDFTMLGNSWAAKYTDVSIGHQKSNVGNYSTTATNREISGVGVSNFTSYNIYNASIRSFNSTQSFHLIFNASSTSLVLIMIAGGGVGSINITSGTSLSKLYDFTYSEGGHQVNASAAAYDGVVSQGTFTITINSTMNASTNSGTGGVVGAVAYVFSSTASSSSGIYSITFTESGLLSGTSWSVTLNGLTGSSTSGTITFSEPNGTYQYSIIPPSDYIAFITSGNVHVSGKSVLISIPFIKSGPMGVGEGMVYYNNNIYYANTSHNIVEVFSASTHKYLEGINVGSEPNSLSMFYSYLISVNSGSDNISIINTKTNDVIANFNAGIDPVGISVVPSLYQIYITNFLSKNITIISTGFNSNSAPNFSDVRISSLPVPGNPSGIVAYPYVPVHLYVSISNLHSVAVYNYASGNTFSYNGMINTGYAPMGLTINDLGELFVADSGSSDVTVAFPIQQSNVPGPQSNTTSISLGRSDPVGVASSSISANAVTFVTYGDGGLSYIENFLPYSSFSAGIKTSSSVAPINGSSLYYFAQGGISLFQLNSVVFDFSGGPGAFQINNVTVGAPTLALPVGLWLANGSYTFSYTLLSGYDNLHFQTSGSVTISNASTKMDLVILGGGSINAVSDKIVSDSWLDSNAFDISTGFIPLQILASLFGSNSQIPDIAVYQVMKSSSVSEQEFAQNLSSYFNISVPDSFLPSGVIIIHIPFIKIVNVVFDQNIPVKQYSLDVGALLGSIFMENHPYVNITDNGSLNIALTLSYSTNTSGLFNQILNIATSLVTSLLKSTTAGDIQALEDSIGTILDHLDVSINIIQSSLNQAGHLSSYAIFDFHYLYNVLKKVNQIKSLLMDLISIPQYIQNGEFYDMIAAIVPPPIDIIPLSLSFYDYTVAFIKSAEVVSGSLSFLFPSLNSNHIFDDVKEGITIAGIIADPNGSTVQPAFYNTSGDLVLGYDNITGIEITNSTSGYYYSNSYGFLAFMNSSENYSVQINHVGGNSTVPYIVLMQDNLSEISYTYAGIVENNSYANLNISSMDGTIVPQLYLSPSAILFEKQQYFQVMVIPSLSNGAIVATNNGFLMIDGTTIIMFRNGTYLEAKIPYGMELKGTADIYVNSNYTGGFTTLVIPEVYKATFTESNLPFGTAWYVNISNGIDSGPITGDSYSLSLSNGTYSYIVATSNKIYSPSPSSGSVPVIGNDINLAITFTKVIYTITFTESGLLSGTSWSVTLNGSIESSTSGTITFTEPNGTYSYSIGNISGYIVSKQSGTTAVSGNNMSVSTTFTASPPPSGISNTELYGIIGAAIAIIAIGSAIFLIRKRK